MNYAKVIGAALQLFPKKIKVTFIDAVAGGLLSKQKMDFQLLPQYFNKPVTIELNNKKWRVIKAEPANVDDYMFSKKLKLYIRDANAPELLEKYLVPTLANPLPDSATTCLFNDFILNIVESDWRQIEFLPVRYLPVVQEEMKLVEPIVFPQNDNNLLLGFNSMHIRAQTGGQNLSIPFDDFCEATHIHEKGAISINEQGFVENGFAARSENYIYYGTMRDGFIENMALQNFECVDDEFINITSRYDMLLADWCNTKITMNGNEEFTNEYQEVADKDYFGNE